MPLIKQQLVDLLMMGRDAFSVVNLSYVDDSYEASNRVLNAKLARGIFKASEQYHGHPIMLYVEAGSYVGNSIISVATEAWKMGLQNITTFVAIDPWTGDVPMWRNEYAHVTHGEPSIMPRFIANVYLAGLSQSVVPLRQTSLSGIKMLRVLAAEKKIASLPQALYLDSAHERGETLLELQNAWSALPAGSILYGDDWAWPAVRHDVSAFASCLPPMGRTARGIAHNLTMEIDMPILKRPCHPGTKDSVSTSRSHHGKNALHLEQLLCLRIDAPTQTNVAAREVLLLHGSWVVIKGPGDDAFAESTQHLPWCNFLQDFSLLRAGSVKAAGEAEDDDGTSAIKQRP